MERLAAGGLVVMACGLATLGPPAAVTAHHPGGGGEGGPWFLITVLALVLAFFGFWRVASVLERREKRSSRGLHRRTE